ncbi:MAG: exonuclease domain-containing protein [Chloroflexi bacterium]|nr:exonuclease domain-containing protein [Chloroflexota bacterium]
MLTNTYFAVVDLETTGVFPNMNDRVIEIAVVHADLRGNILDEYTTLVNPNRDISGTGISAREVTNAPLFGEIAGDILSLLARSIFVAHNVYFDMRFIHSEFRRIGCILPEFPYLCTMQLARKADPDIPSRQLGELCKYFGIELSQPHRALDDARATASLLHTCLSRLAAESKKYFSIIGIIGQPIERHHWPELPVTRKPYPRSQAAQDILSDPSYIGHLIPKLPATTCSQSAIEDYLVLLDRVLEDRRVSPEESEALYNLAQQCGISRTQAIAAHHLYMRDLIQNALEDGVITESESKDLEEVRSLLSISDAEYKMILEDMIEAHARGEFRKPVNVLKSLDVKGKSVCFSGELNCRIKEGIASRFLAEMIASEKYTAIKERFEKKLKLRFLSENQIFNTTLAEMIAAEKGMVVKNYVTKTLDFLVAGDPDSMSTKAKKARRYGVRIISEPVFWQMMGIQVE